MTDLLTIDRVRGVTTRGLFLKRIKSNIKFAIFSSAFIGAQAFALQVRTTGFFENSTIDIGSCQGYALHYEGAVGSGIGNAFALLLGDSLQNQYGVNPHFDGVTLGIPYSSDFNINELTPDDLLGYCGISDAVLTVTGVASGSYASTSLIGYKLEGKDPKNGNASTVWEVAVSGVINTRTFAKKSSIVTQSDSGSGIAGTPITPINVLANDSTNGAPSTLGDSVLTLVTPASDSGVVLDPASGFVSTTAAVPPGTYTLTYELCNAAVPTLCSRATVEVKLGQAAQPPVINDASYTIQVGTSASGNAGTGGKVPLGSVFQTVIPPAHGQLTIDPATGVFTYTPNAGYTGRDTATVRVCLPAPNNTVCDDAVLAFNVRSGGNGPAATPVPTLGEWALIGLASMVAMLGVGRIRRRQN